jgi:hypothetical protein
VGCSAIGKNEVHTGLSVSGEEKNELILELQSSSWELLEGNNTKVQRRIKRDFMTKLLSISFSTRRFQWFCHAAGDCEALPALATPS